MKKILIIMLLVLPIPTQSILASGIPTVDIAGLLQGLMDGMVRVKEFKEQIDGARQRLSQMKESAEDYKDMVEGHYDFETLLNDPTINEALALEDWREIYNSASDIRDLRDEFDLHSDDPAVQSKFDKELQAYQAQTKFYKMSVERNENLRSLLDQFSVAENPAAKADLQNSIQFENTQIQNDAKMMETMTALMEQNATLESIKNTIEKKRKMREEGYEIDYSSAYSEI